MSAADRPKDPSDGRKRLLKNEPDLIVEPEPGTKVTFKAYQRHYRIRRKSLP